MSESLKIAIIGDYNFTYNSHQATNLSIDHSSRFLEIEINYYWIKINEAAQLKPQAFEQYDGIWVAPGPYKSIFFLGGIIDVLQKLEIPVLITGESFRSLIENIINKNQLNPNGEKLISDNLVEGQQFERVQIIPHTTEFIKIYDNHSTIELTSSRYSLYPQLIEQLTSNHIDIEAYNQFEEPEVVSLKKHKFFLACGFCPQISSTRDIAHPLIYTFIKACKAFAKDDITEIESGDLE
jgi:CTP synthase (UTP-ammonia lyase)